MRTDPISNKKPVSIDAPSISVLVTVYNRAAYLRDTLESIQASTYQDFEVVIVDDCSTDESVEIAREFASQDQRFKSFVNDENLGDYGNRNRAASLAQGNYLKYVDADDLIYPHSLSVMVEAMENCPDAALALSSNVIDPPQPYPRFYSPSDFFQAHFLGTSPIGVGPSAAIIRRSTFDEVGGFSGKQFVGDTELWLKLAESWPVVNLPPALVWWRQHPDQQIQLEQTKPQVLNTRYRLAKETLLSTKHLTPEQRVTAEKRLRNNHARMLLGYGIRHRSFSIAYRLIKESKLSMLDLACSLYGYR